MITSFLKNFTERIVILRISCCSYTHAVSTTTFGRTILTLELIAVEAKKAESRAMESASIGLRAYQAANDSVHFLF